MNSTALKALTGRYIHTVPENWELKEIPSNKMTENEFKGVKVFDGNAITLSLPFGENKYNPESIKITNNIIELNNREANEYKKKELETQIEKEMQSQNMFSTNHGTEVKTGERIL